MGDQPKHTSNAEPGYGVAPITQRSASPPVNRGQRAVPAHAGAFAARQNELMMGSREEQREDGSVRTSDRLQRFSSKYEACCG